MNSQTIKNPECKVGVSLKQYNTGGHFTMNHAANAIHVDQTTINGESVYTVNARDLHAFLESKQDFSDWIKLRIRQYKFVQGIDFVVFHSFMDDATAFGGQRKSIEYLLTLDTAKELSMVERTLKGREVRRYFIACEKTLQRRHNNLFVQMNRVDLEVQRQTELASFYGRGLQHTGKVTKPASVAALEAIKRQIQPLLPFEVLV